MVTQLPCKKPSLRLIQPFRWEQPVCRLSSWKSTLGWLSYSPEVLTNARSTTSSCSVPPSLVATGTPALQHVTQKSFFFPNRRLASTWHSPQRSQRHVPKPYPALCSQQAAAPCQRETSHTDLPTQPAKRWKIRERADCTCFEVLLPCEVPCPPPHKESKSLLFWPVFLIRGKYSNYSPPDYKWNYKSVLRAQYCPYLDVIRPQISFNLDRCVVQRHRYRKLYK